LQIQTHWPNILPGKSSLGNSQRLGYKQHPSIHQVSIAEIKLKIYRNRPFLHEIHLRLSRGQKLSPPKLQRLFVLFLIKIGLFSPHSTLSSSEWAPVTPQTFRNFQRNTQASFSTFQGNTRDILTAKITAAAVLQPKLVSNGWCQGNRFPLQSEYIVSMPSRPYFAAMGRNSLSSAPVGFRNWWANTATVAMASVNHHLYFRNSV
jgi:hypothetical protein